MTAIKDASGIKGDSKPKLDAEDIGADHGTDEGSISSIGEKNISTNAQGGGDGSLSGDAPNTFRDVREVHETEDTASPVTRVDTE